MSRERELIDKYNYLIDLYKFRNINDEHTKYLEKQAHYTLFELSEYMRDNLNNIEDQDLLDYTMARGINNVEVCNNRFNAPCDICPSTYQKLDNSRVMVIADIHYIARSIGPYGYRKMSKDYLDSALYYANQTGIKELIVLGDLVDGKYYDNKTIAYVDQKTLDDYYNEISDITSYLKTNLPNTKVRAILGNHDNNALSYYSNKYGYNEQEKGFKEYISCFKNNNIKLDGIGSVIYNYNGNNVLFEHHINKFFGMYNPFEVNYEGDRDYLPINNYRSISGHAHTFKFRRLYLDRDEISNAICPCLKSDFDRYDGATDLIEYPGFLILDFVGEDILVEPYFINKNPNGIYDINSLEHVSELAKEKNSYLPEKFRTYHYDKKIILKKVIN